MSPRIYCQSERCECPTPERCMQDCHFNTADLDSVSVPRRAPAFKPDYGIEHTKVSRELTPLGWLIAIAAVAVFVLAFCRIFS